MEMRNKNNCEKCQRFVKSFIIKTNAVDMPVVQERLIRSQIQPTEITKEQDVGPNRIYSIYVTKKRCRKRKALPPRKDDNNPYCLKPRWKAKDVTGKHEGSPNDFKLRCNYVEVTGKLEDSRHGNYCSSDEHLKTEPFDLPSISGVHRQSNDMQNRLLPAKFTSDVPLVPEHDHVNDSTEASSSVPAHINESNIRSDIQSQPHSSDSTHFNSGNTHVPMDVLENEDSLNLGQAVSHDGPSRNVSAFYVLQNDSRNELCIDGSSYNHTRQSHFCEISRDTDLRLPPPAVVQQNRTFPLGQLISSTSGQHQQYRQQDRETTLTEPARHQLTSQQQNGNDDLVYVLGRVRSPGYANLTDRLLTFSKWPSVIAQTPAQVAEAGFYYTGFQDIVRCFACDGGLKNWDPDDDPWVEHARWFPQCAYVRHMKGEEFINLVRMSTEESDEEDEFNVQGGASWGGVENSNISTSQVAHEVTEPSVLENMDAQLAIEMGFSKKDVAMAINNIFKKGKEDFTCQEIADILLEKGTSGEPSNSTLDVDCLPSVGNMSATGHAKYENRSLKESLFCIECKSKERNILFLPCTHHVVCESCSRDLHICTYCYRKIKDKIRTYMS